MLPPEPEVLEGRLSFVDAQAALGGSFLPFQSDVSCGWFGTVLEDERGWFAIVSEDTLADLVGDTIRVTLDDVSLIVYVVSSDSLDWDLALTRQAFSRLALLAEDSVSVTVEVTA